MKACQSESWRRSQKKRKRRRRSRNSDRNRIVPGGSPSLLTSSFPRCNTTVRCPFCGFVEDKVVDSREAKIGDTIRRRRQCEKCKRRFTTYERIDEIPYMVVKKDGRREKFDRQKILAGLLKACEKRPVPMGKLE